MDHGPNTRDGLPIYYSEEPIVIVITKLDGKKAVPRSAEKCAIALAIQRQLAVPPGFVHILRTRAWVALPVHGKTPGEKIPGRPGKWGCFGFRVTTATKKLLIQVDTPVGPEDIPLPLTITLAPFDKFESTEGKAEARNRYNARRKAGTVEKRETPRKPDPLTLAGLRNYANRSPR